eukprot:2482363-Amphidinium_carterae.1
MWWILPIPLSEQKHKLPKITPGKRSDEQVSKSPKWTEAKPVGVVGLYVDDTLAGATNAICQGLMSWIKGVWNTGQVEYAGPDDPNTIRFLGLNLDYIAKKLVRHQIYLHRRSMVKQGLNLAGVAGSLNWLALRSDLTSLGRCQERQDLIVTKQPSVAFHRFKHIAQYLRWCMDLGLRFMQPTEQQRKMLVVGLRGCKLCPNGRSSEDGQPILFNFVSPLSRLQAKQVER